MAWSPKIKAKVFFKDGVLKALSKRYVFPTLAVLNQNTTY